MTYAEGGTGGVGSSHSQRSGRASGVETADLTHEEVLDQLSELLADSLDEPQRTRVAGHLSRCVACAAYLATLKRSIQLLQTLPTHTAPSRVRQRLLAIPDDASAPER